MTNNRVIKDSVFNNMLDDLRETVVFRLATKWGIDPTEDEVTWIDDSITQAIRDMFIIEED